MLVGSFSTLNQNSAIMQARHSNTKIQPPSPPQTHTVTVQFLPPTPNLQQHNFPSLYLIKCAKQLLTHTLPLPETNERQVIIQFLPINECSVCSYPPSPTLFSLPFLLFRLQKDKELLKIGFSFWPSCYPATLPIFLFPFSSARPNVLPTTGRKSTQSVTKIETETDTIKSHCHHASLLDTILTQFFLTKFHFET